MRALFFGLCVLFLTGAAVAHTAWPKECRLSRVGTFPLRDIGMHVAVPVTVNGTPENFIVDTGGYATSLTANAATALGLRTHGMHLMATSDIGGKSADKYVTADIFALGALKARNFELMLSDQKHADGILAPDLLRNFDVEFDFQNKTLNLFKPHPCDGKAVYWTQQYIALPIDITHGGHTRASITLDGKDANAVLDTGASTSLISMERAGFFFGLTPDSPGVTLAGKATGGSGGTAKLYHYNFKVLTMGGVAVTNPLIGILDNSDFLEGDNASLLLGMTELRHLHLYFAYQERVLYVSAADAN